jgi:hypothetical protein
MPSFDPYVKQWMTTILSSKENRREQKGMSSLLSASFLFTNCLHTGGGGPAPPRAGGLGWGRGGGFGGDY